MKGLGKSGGGYWIPGYIDLSDEGKLVINPGSGGFESSNSIKGTLAIASSACSSSANISASGS